MQTSTQRYIRVPGQLPQPVAEVNGTERAARPKNIPMAEWPDDPKLAVPEVRYDETGAELPRYRAAEPCQREDVIGGRVVEIGQEFYEVGFPAHFMEPVNQAAIDMTMQHPPGEGFDPVALLPI